METEYPLHQLEEGRKITLVTFLNITPKELELTGRLPPKDALKYFCQRDSAITPKELRAIKLEPNECVYFVYVTFGRDNEFYNKRHNSRDYDITHTFGVVPGVPEQIKSTHLLYGGDLDEKAESNFKDVERIITEVTKGKPREPRSPPLFYSTIGNDIDVPNLLTLRMVADIIEEYEKYFRDVRIRQAQFLFTSPQQFEPERFGSLQERLFVATSEKV